MKEGRDVWLDDYYPKASADFVTKIMDAEDPLFILYTSGSTGKPKECCTLLLVYGLHRLYF